MLWLCPVRPLYTYSTKRANAYDTRVDFVAVVVVAMRPLLAERMRRRQATSEATKTVRKNNQETKSAFNQSNSQAYDPTDKQTNIRQHQKRCSTCKRFSVSSVVTFTPIQQQLDHHVSKYSLENHHVALAKRAFVASNWGLPKMFSLWAVLSTILLIWNLKFFRFISFGL